MLVHSVASLPLEEYQSVSGDAKDAERQWLVVLGNSQQVLLLHGKQQ